MPVNVAVTGASGFVGRLLVRQLIARGDTVRVLTRDRTRANHPPPSVEVCVGDLASGAEVPAAFVGGSDVIYHCAGEINRPAAMRLVHIEGTRALVKAAANRVRHRVQLSSVGVYGPVRDGSVDETQARVIVLANPHEPYPRRWWTNQDVARNVMLETVKALYYLAGDRFTSMPSAQGSK